MNRSFFSSTHTMQLQPVSRYSAIVTNCLRLSIAKIKNYDVLYFGKPLLPFSQPDYFFLSSFPKINNIWGRRCFAEREKKRQIEREEDMVGLVL